MHPRSFRRSFSEISQAVEVRVWVGLRLITRVTYRIALSSPVDNSAGGEVVRRGGNAGSSRGEGLEPLPRASVEDRAGRAGEP